ncbi:hypothetical protein DFH06DRAFT_1472575 [Mycena polygramma]|nr:hypothetical protein DFH06DRAFT_1472575 [Mycena polygramma]
MTAQSTTIRHEPPLPLWGQASLTVRSSPWPVCHRRLLSKSSSIVSLGPLKYHRPNKPPFCCCRSVHRGGFSHYLLPFSGSVTVWKWNWITRPCTTKQTVEIMWLNGPATLLPLPCLLGLFEALRPMPARMSTLIARYGPRCECLRLRPSLKSVAELSDPGTLPLLRTPSIAYSLGSILHNTCFQGHFGAPGTHTRTTYRALDAYLPWGQLTTFTGDSLSVAECLFVLRSSPRLTKCTFIYLLPGASGGRNLTHSSLEDFSISNSAADILGYIELPALRGLHLAKLMLIDTNALRRLFACCAPSLHRLQYAPTYLYRDSVFIHAMPHLTDLDLSGVGTQFTHAFVRSLNRLHEPMFLPSLRTLRIECEWRDIGVEAGAEVVAALTSRSTDNGEVGFGTQVGAVKLRSFRLIWAEDSWLDALHASAMLELIQGGMDIHIGSARENYIYA